MKLGLQINFGRPSEAVQGDLSTKAMISLLKGCPARVSGLLEIMKDPMEEMLIQREERVECR
jgi:hypothetical protein